MTPRGGTARSRETLADGTVQARRCGCQPLDPATDLTVAFSPSIRRVRKLEERGTPANGVITGVKFTLNDDMTRKDYAVTALGSGRAVRDPSIAARAPTGCGSASRWS